MRRARAVRGQQRCHWPITVTPATASPKAPEILTPTDPTHTAPGGDHLLSTSSAGRTTGTVHVVDQGSVPNVVPRHHARLRTGSSRGDHARAPGRRPTRTRAGTSWCSTRAAPASQPVFVSVGIDPPTVEFPRNGAEIDCETADPQGPRDRDRDAALSAGRVRPPARDRRDRAPGARVRSARRPDHRAAAAGAADPVRHRASTRGRAATSSTSSRRPISRAADAGRRSTEHFRAYAQPGRTRRRAASSSSASRRASRSRWDSRASWAAAAPCGGPHQPAAARAAGVAGSFPINSPRAGRTPTRRARCARCRNADVNVRVGQARLHARAPTADGTWSLNLPLRRRVEPPDVRAGLGLARRRRLERELPVERDRRRRPRVAAAPVITVPPDMTVDATSPQGAQVFYPDVTAVRAYRRRVACRSSAVPPSGSTFRARAATEVLCTATDPATGAVGLGRVRDHRRRRAADDQVASNVTLEATGPAGATLNAYTNVVVVGRCRSAPVARVHADGAAPLPARPDDARRVHGDRQSRTSRRARSSAFTVRRHDAARPVHDVGPQGRHQLGRGRDRQLRRLQGRATSSTAIDPDDLRSLRRGRSSRSGKTLVKCAATDKPRQPVGADDVHRQRRRHDAAGPRSCRGR